MIYDRLREWQTPPKYRRVKQQRITRMVNTPTSDMQLHATLSSIGVFLDYLSEKATWQIPALELDLDFQRLTAEALMAISSTSYDTKAVRQELSDMEERMAGIVGTFSVAMHPRVLSVLLRVLVQNQQTNDVQRGLVNAFRGMIGNKVSKSLRPSHPVSMLCALDLPPVTTEDFLVKFTTQLNSRLHERVRGCAPDFIALEKIYIARAMASFGCPKTADTVLDSAATLSICDTFTKAEYHRTVRFSQFQKDTPAMTDAAIPNLSLAVTEYEGIDKSTSTEAMYVHYNLGSAFRRKRDFESCIHHLESALDIWKGNSATHQQRGGIKYVLDLNEAYSQVGWNDSMESLHEQYASYFAESPLVQDI